jgi:predicted dehydrogenase
MMRIGFIGAGNVATPHLAALQAREDAQVVAFLDPIAERAQQRVAEFGGRAVPDLAALWDLVDAVWVCSPPHLHAEHAVAAARAGRHVFVERPIANSLAAADQIVEACRQAGVQLMVGHALRHAPIVVRMRQLLVDGDLGNLVACWSRRYAEASPAELPWWLRDWRRGGGFTIEWGIQEVDFIRWVGEAGGGPVRKVYGRTVCSRPAYPDFDTFARATLTFESGAVGGFEGGLAAPLGGGAARTVLGTRAMAIIEGRALRLRYTGDGAERTVAVAPASDPERRVSAATLAQTAEFLDAVAANRRPAVPGEEGRAALAICLAIHRSSREGREVALEEM